MDAPQNLEQAKAMVQAEKAKLTGSLSAIAGSRWLTAVAAVLAIAFAANVLYSPHYLPSIGGVSLASIGLPDNLDFGVVGEQAIEAREAAVREGAPDRVSAFINENRNLVPLLNWAGLALAMAALLANLWIMTKRRRFTRG
ncbi:MAG: hypothetical protein K2P58_12490 [Hyphomonadaceae bacterium]|nr:hypothetical protein [Hyphomonadaceae bacterium]